MPDYKKMYFHLFKETARAIKILTEAQEETERIYVEETSDNNLVMLPKIAEKENPDA